MNNNISDNLRDVLNEYAEKPDGRLNDKLLSEFEKRQQSKRTIPFLAIAAAFLAVAILASSVLIYASGKLSGDKNNAVSGKVQNITADNENAGNSAEQQNIRVMAAPTEAEPYRVTKIYDDNRKNKSYYNMPTTDGRSIIGDRASLDLESGEYTGDFVIMGSYDEPYGIAQTYGISDILCKDGGYYYLMQGSLYFNKDGESQLLMSAAENKADRVYSILVADDGSLVLFGKNNVCSFDLSSKTCGKMTFLGDEAILFAGLIGNDIFVASDLHHNIMYVVSLRLGKILATREEVYNIKCFNDRIYYVTYEDGNRVLRSCLPDLSDDKKEMDGIGYFFYVMNDGTIFHDTFEPGKYSRYCNQVLLRRTPDGEENEILNLGKSKESFDLSGEIYPVFDGNMLLINISNPNAVTQKFLLLNLESGSLRAYYD